MMTYKFSENEIKMLVRNVVAILNFASELFG